jgi:uncharacterized protein YchJ
VVRVRTVEEAQEIVAICKQRKWEVIAGVEPDNYEDISDLEKLMRAAEERAEVKPRLPPKISGTDYCPCRSGKKYKKCCGAAISENGQAKAPALLNREIR